MEREEKRYSILDELAKNSGYDIALMTTFNFEIEFFERAVLNRLNAKDIKTISLFVDAKELTNALNEFDLKHNGSHIGRRYMVNPVKIEKSFHPKVILLLGEKKARLFIGSANIKTSGYATNNEVFNFLDYDSNHPEFRDVIVSAIDFFSDINDISYKLDNQVLKAAKDRIYYHRAEKNGEVYFLNNLKDSLLQQIDTIIQSDVKKISVAVPYYDKELLALQELKKMFPEAEVNLFIQNKYSTFPIEYNDKNGIVDKINTFKGFKDNTTVTNGNFYHGKVFLFKTVDKSYILYGSSNCTLSAITKSFADGGNIECDFLEVGGLSDFDYFFDNMLLSPEEDFTSQKMVFESPKSANFSFKYGEIKESIELHFGYSKKIDDIIFKFQDIELEYEIKNDEILVYIKEECCELLTDIFEITILYDNKEEKLRCWTYSSIILSSYREKQNNRDNLDDYEIECSGDKYIEYQIKYLKAEATCLSDLMEHQNNLKYMNQIMMEQEGYEPEDFVIDYEIPDEYRIAYRQQCTVSRIRNMFVRRFIGASGIGIFSDKDERLKNDVEEVPTESVNRVSRRATSEEKKFEYFVKGKIKAMLNDSFVDAIELEHYIGLVQVVMEIFDKYCEKDPVEDIFTFDYVISIKIQLLKRIVSKTLDMASDTEEIRSAIINKCFIAIFENYLFYRELTEQEEKWKYESLNKDLLKSMEKQFNLRQKYKAYITDIFKGNSFLRRIMGEKYAIMYIEKLYGYKTYDMLIDTIRKKYPNAEIEIDNDVLNILIKTDSFADYMKPNSEVLRDISNYSSNVSPVNVVNIDVKNEILKKENPMYVIENKHIINLRYHQWKFKQITISGKVIDYKGQSITF